MAVDNRQDQALSAGTRKRNTLSASVRIFGQEYTLRGEAKPSYMQELAERVDSRMREIARNYPSLDAVQVAVLTAVNLMDEQVRLDEQYRRVLMLLEREWDRRRGRGEESHAVE